jgi:putative IMPACT (imprinted ancient) family translation regulator
MIGPKRLDWQLNDNGEPSGTAGKPILGQINSVGVTNVLVIVVRYFGGIKLGTSGLISAYKEAARLALEDAGIKENYSMCKISISFPYMSMNSVMKIVKGGDVEVLSQQFDNVCVMTLLTRCSKEDEIRGKLMSIDGVTEQAD